MRHNERLLQPRIPARVRAGFRTLTLLLAVLEVHPICRIWAEMRLDLALGVA